MSKSERCPCCNELAFSKVEKVLTFWAGRECPHCSQRLKVGGALYKLLAVVLHWSWLIAVMLLIFIQKPILLGVVIGIFGVDFLNKVYVGQLLPK